MLLMSNKLKYYIFYLHMSQALGISGKTVLPEISQARVSCLKS